jgi:hypothetical protein
MDARDALGPLEFQFQDETDQAKYGDRWYRYAESDVMRLSARKLIELEARMGLKVVEVMNGMRESSILGDTAAAWIGVRLEDPDLAGPFDDFNPATLMIKWRKAEPGKAPAAEDTPKPQAEPEAAQTSDPAPTVVLQTSPIAE